MMVKKRRSTAADMARGVIRVGVSSCLLGQKVRWDGDHRSSRYVTDILGSCVSLVSVCPELEVGMGVPREPVHLEGDFAAPCMIGNVSGEDWTDRMNRYAAHRLSELAGLRLSGFILQHKSPSCGMARVPVRDEHGKIVRKGSGLFAALLQGKFPLLPVEEEGRLCDARLRENFVVRLFAYHRLQNLFTSRFSRDRVVQFHARQKLLLMAHSPRHGRELDRLVATIADYTPAEFKTLYRQLTMRALRVKTTRQKNVQVLRYVMSQMSPQLAPSRQQSILQVIEAYRSGCLPLIAPFQVSLFGAERG